MYAPFVLWLGICASVCAEFLPCLHKEIFVLHNQKPNHSFINLRHQPSSSTSTSTSTSHLASTSTHSSSKMEPFDLTYSPAAAGSLMNTGNDLLAISHDEDLVNMSPEECQEFVHLCLHLYEEARKASVLGYPPDYLQRSVAKKYFINNKPTRSRHATQTNAMLIGLVSAQPRRYFIKANFVNQ